MIAFLRNLFWPFAILFRWPHMPKERRVVKHHHSFIPVEFPTDAVWDEPDIQWDYEEKEYRR